MKNLDLAALGVEEMTETQMQQVDGGNAGAVARFIMEAILSGLIYDTAIGGAMSYINTCKDDWRIGDASMNAM